MFLTKKEIEKSKRRRLSEIEKAAYYFLI